MGAVGLPAGYYVRYGGQFENLERARTRLLVVVPVALALIFVLLYFTYGRVLDAVRVFTGVPFAAIGGVVALWLRGMPFSISAGVGFVALSGVVGARRHGARLDHPAAPRTGELRCARPSNRRRSGASARC